MKVLHFGSWVVLAAGLLLCTVPLVAAEPAAEKQRAITAQAIARWQKMRFGMFIHWGPVSLKGTEIGWSRGAQIPVAEYDQLYKHFNPVNFDADAWVQVAKQAGMKYLIITSKHHDGFCLWPSKVTDYDIAGTPLHRDVLKQLSAACRRAGIAFGTYYSVCDWHHPDFPRGSPGGRTRKPHPNLNRYITQYLRKQVTELIQNYGPLIIMWFDVPQEVGPELGKPTVAMVRALQPDIIVNNRAYRGGGEPVGDYDTPEQRIGGFNRSRPWETCMTICRQWAWKPKDKLKSRKECLQTLLRVVGGDGNLLLNVGPMPDGRIEPRQVARLKQVGQWLRKYGQGVYGTRGGPWKPGAWGAATCKDHAIYLFVMQWPDAGPLQLPAIGAKITAAETLTRGTARVGQTGDGVTVALAAADRDPVATVIRLAVDGSAVAIEPVSVPHRSDSLAYGKPVKASNVFAKMSQFGPGAAVDDDRQTRWATDSGTSAAWLEVDLGKPSEIGGALIDEPAPYQRVEAFELQYLDGNTWKTFYTGKKIGPHHQVNFPALTARRVRLNILEATDGPTLWEFQLVPPGKSEIDLLTPPPTATDLGHWKFFSEDAKAGFADTWRMDHGVLVCRGLPLGYLYTKKKYTDFVLSLQYRVPPDAKPYKGGILVRVTGEHKIWPRSLEAQINDPDAGDFWGLNGFRFDGPADRRKRIERSPFGALTHLAKAVDAAKPIGQWNDYTVRAQGRTVTLILNGREVNRATDCDVVAGPILLTAEGNAIHFRNIKLRGKANAVE